MAHANARLTVHGRALLVERVLAGHRPADVAHQMGCSRATAYKWLRRFRAEGASGLLDRSSRPAHCPHRTPAAIEARILETAPGAIGAGPTGSAPSSALPPRPWGGCSRATGCPCWRDLDALTGEPVRRGPVSRVRYERARPGELIHIDVKKLGRIPDGGGWRAHGRRHNRPKRLRGQGFDYVHSAIDDHSRLAYTEIHPDEQGDTCAGFLGRAAAFFDANGITRIERVMTDNAFNYRRSGGFQAVLADARRQRHPDPPLLPLDQRQGRTLQPHPARGVGILAGLPLERRARRVPDRVAPALQHAEPTQRARRAATDQPPVDGSASATGGARRGPRPRRRPPRAARGGRAWP